MAPLLSHKGVCFVVQSRGCACIFVISGFHTAVSRWHIVERHIFEVHNFRGLAFSTFLWKQYLRIKDSININTVFFNFAELNFRGSMPICKKS